MTTLYYFHGIAGTPIEWAVFWGCVAMAIASHCWRWWLPSASIITAWLILAAFAFSRHDTNSGLYWLITCLPLAAIIGWIHYWLVPWGDAKLDARAARKAAQE